MSQLLPGLVNEPMPKALVKSNIFRKHRNTYAYNTSLALVF